MELTIKQVTATSYVVPVIDNRRRSAYGMWAAIMDTDYRIGTLIQLDGSMVKVEFEALGWRIVA